MSDQPPRVVREWILTDSLRLLRLYRGQRPADVIHRAITLLAQADGLLTADGKPKTRRDR